ncbi:MAG: DUF3604 domain-containing protein, partial [Mycobacteriales bacterium]
HDERGALGLQHYPDEDALATARLGPRSIDEAAWLRTAKIADEHDVPGEFTALRGFEWTEPWLGHVNVWFSDSYLPVTTPGQVHGLHEWLADHEPDALFGYNHPGREPGRLHDFAGPDAAYLVDADPARLTGRMVALELFNRTFDFLFEGVRDGLSSPIVACLDAGWRPGFIGCSDEHGTSYGLAGKGRAGLWVDELSRDGVRDALARRRTFATREARLRLDTTLDGVRMGESVVRAGRQEVRVDLADPAYDGTPVELQVIVSDGAGMPEVLTAVPARRGEVTSFDVVVPDEAAWMFVRVADPSRTNTTPGPRGHRANNHALAYSTPWWLTP